MTERGFPEEWKLPDEEESACIWREHEDALCRVLDNLEELVRERPELLGHIKERRAEA